MMKILTVVAVVLACKVALKCVMLIAVAKRMLSET